MKPAYRPPAIQSAPRFRGPPHECWYCGGGLHRVRQASHPAGGCLLVILGLIGTPYLIGIPILLYGLHLGSLCVGFYRCRQCESTFPRRVRWHEGGVGILLVFIAFLIVVGGLLCIAYDKSPITLAREWSTPDPPKPRKP